MEDLTFGEQVKIILGRKGMSIKQLAELIEENTGKKMSRQNLTQRLGRDNFQEQDMRMIAEILECPFQLSIMGGDIQTRRRAGSPVEKPQEDLENTGAEQAVQKQDVQEPQISGKEVSGKEKNSPSQELAPDERDMTIGELYDIHKELSELEENVRAGGEVQPDRAAEAVEAVGQYEDSGRKAYDFEPVITHEDAEENVQVGEVNPYTGREYQSNSVRMHPTRIGYVQVYDRAIHKWTDMTEWAFLGLQERKKALLGKAYEPPVYLD